MIYPPRAPILYDLCKQGTLQHFRKGEQVFSRENKTDLMFMFQGYVKRYLVSEKGALGVQIIYGPEDIFSLTNLYRQLLDQSIYDGRETYYYRAITDADVYTLNMESFKKAAGANLALYQELFAEAGHHLKTCVHNLENMSLPNVHARLAHQLLFFAREFGEETPYGTKLLVKLTQQDIADVLIMARETVSKGIAQLREKGIVQTSPDFIIRDMAALEAEIYSPSPQSELDMPAGDQFEE